MTVGSTRTFSADGFIAQYVDVSSQEGYSFDWQGGTHYVALHNLRRQDGETFADDVRVTRERDLNGRLTFVPAGCRAWGWLVPTPRPHSFTALYVDPSALEESLAPQVRGLTDRARLYFTHAALRSTLEKLQVCLMSEGQHDRLYAESLCTLAALELSQSPARQARAAADITQRVVEYMTQNLGGDITLSDLANVANLSRFHFLRAFKNATQETPYQFLLRCRVERAQELLRADMSIAEIAVAVGFKNSTRLAAAFRRLRHCSPSEYRSSIRR